MAHELPMDEFQNLFIKYFYPQDTYDADWDEDFLRLHLQNLRNVSDSKLKDRVLDADKNRLSNEQSLCDIADTGFMGTDIPTDYGGAGRTYLDYAMGLFEIGRASGDQSTTLDIEISHVVQSILKTYASDELKQRLLPKLAQGQVDGELFIASFGQSEQEHGSDAQNLESTLIQHESGDYFVANGRKVWITNIGDVTIYTLNENVDTSGNAVTQPDGPPRLTAVVVDRDAPGHTILPGEDTMGHRSSPTTQRILENVRIPSENIIGERGQGFKYMMHGLNEGRYGITLSGISGLAHVLDKCKKRVIDRKQFGKSIIDYHAVREKMALMEQTVLASQLLAYHGAMKIDNGEDIRYHAAATKVFATEFGIKAADQATRVWGAEGYMTDTEIERCERDIKLLHTGEGTSDILRGVIARYLLKKGVKDDSISAYLDTRYESSRSTVGSEDRKLSNDEQTLIGGISGALGILKKSIEILQKNPNDAYYNMIGDMASVIEGTKALAQFAIVLADKKEDQADRVLAMSQRMALKMAKTVADNGNQFLHLSGQPESGWNPAFIYHNDRIALENRIVAPYLPS